MSYIPISHIHISPCLTAEVPVSCLQQPACNCHLHFPPFTPSRCQANNFLYTSCPPLSITSPWQGIILSKSHPLIFLALASNPFLSPLLATYHKNLFCHVADPTVFWNPVKNLVNSPSVAFSPVRLYCSCAGRLNNMSASISALSGLWQKTNSLFA